MENKTPYRLSVCVCVYVWRRTAKVSSNPFIIRTFSTNLYQFSAFDKRRETTQSRMFCMEFIHRIHMARAWGSGSPERQCSKWRKLVLFVSGLNQLKFARSLSVTLVFSVVHSKEFATVFKAPDDRVNRFSLVVCIWLFDVCMYACGCRSLYFSMLENCGVCVCVFDSVATKQTSFQCFGFIRLHNMPNFDHL